MFVGTSEAFDIDDFDLWMDFHGRITAVGSELTNSSTNSLKVESNISSASSEEGQLSFNVSLVE
jgi:hypothetical protein